MALFSCIQSPPFSLLSSHPRNLTTPQYPILLLRRISETPIPSPVSWNPRPHVIRSLCSSGEAGSEVHLHTDKPPSNVIFIRGLPSSTSETFLTKTFSQFGTVSKVTILTDGISKQSRGLAYITFARQEGAKSAVKEMNGKFFEGRFIRVMLAWPESPRKKRTPYKF